jgi:hypothetical protein
MPILLAAGSVLFESLFQKNTLRRFRYATVLILTAGGILVAPMALPIVPIEHYAAYEKWIGIRPPQEERGAPVEIPQHHADRFGWKEMTDLVATACTHLSSEELAVCSIFAANYGEAGAIEFHGKDRNLPPVISGHNNYFLWGYGIATSEAVIAVGISLERLQSLFNDVELFATHNHPYGHEHHVPICICRGLKKPMAEIWPGLKHFI